MAHAETCPVCHGIGTIGADQHGLTCPEPRKTCHGCHGKGWVEVGDTIPPFPVQPVRPLPGPETHPWCPCKSTITVGPWVYEPGIYSANVEMLITPR